MNRIPVAICILAILMLALPAGAAFVTVVDEATELTITGRADADTEELAVGSTGNIYYIDEDETGNDRVVRTDSAGSGGIIITTESAIVAAVNAVNGGIVTTDFSINGISVAADGDIILTNGDGSGPDSLVSVVDAAAGAITVVSTAVSPATNSPIEGCVGSSAIGGNIVAVGIEGNFSNGTSGDRVVTVDSNDAGAPAAAATEIITQTQLETTSGFASPDIALNGFSAGGSGILFLNSGSGGTTGDGIMTCTTVGGSFVELFSKAAVLAGLGDGSTDVGYNDVAQDGSGDLWLSNPFGSSGAGNADDGIIKIVDPLGTPQFHVFPETQIFGDVGGAFANAEGMGYDATNSRIVFAIGSEDSAAVVAAVAEASVPVELSVFSAD